MIRFVTGRAGTGKSAFVRESIREELAAGRSAVLLVPEQQTVIWETRMADALPDEQSLRLEITNFTRLANAVFREYGGLADSVADNGSRILLTWRAMVSVWDSLRVYGGGTDSPRNGGNRVSRREDRAVPRLLSAIDDFKTAGISPADAEAALEELRRTEDGFGENADGAGSLADRLSDAVLVYAAYNELLHRSAIDRGDLLSKLADVLAAHPYFRGKSVYVDSFFSLTAPEERLLGLMMRQADNVTVTFPCPTEKSEGEGELSFGETREFLKTATRLAARAGKEAEKIPLTENHRHRNVPDLAAVERFLFRYTEALPELPVGETEGRECVRVLRCADLFDEAEACACLIDRLIREDGLRFSDIAVVARDMKTREGLLDSTLRRHGIACFLSESSEISTSPAVRLVLAALQIIDGGWQRKDVLRLIKTGLTPVNRPAPAEEADESEESVPESAESAEKPEDALNPGDVFEIYTGTWNIHGRRLFTAGSWTMNPDGYQPEITPRAQTLLALANRAKDNLIPPLNRLAQVFDGGAASVRTIAEALVHFAEEYEAADRLEDTARAYEAIGMPADAAKVRRSWDAVCEILDKMVGLLEDDAPDSRTSLDAGRFAGLFSKVARQMDVGSIPTAADEVVLGSSSGVRFDEVKCVILLGSVEGEFPGAVSGGGSFFDDRDREVLAAAGLKLGIPDAAIQTAREYFMYYRTAASAAEQLWILAPAGENGTLSEGARRAVQILEKRGRKPVSVFAEMPLTEIVYCAAAAEYQLSRRTDPAELKLLRALAGADRIPSVPLVGTDDRLSTPAAEAGAGAQSLKLSQSRIETFVSCPFLYTCRFRMNVRPEPRAEIRTPEVGTFVHAVLERFFAGLPAEKMDALPLPWEETVEIADGVIRDYIASLARVSGSPDNDGDSGSSGNDGDSRSSDNDGDSEGSSRSSGSAGDSLDGRLNYLFVRLRRHVLVFLDAIMRELAQSRFRPAAFELPIGLPDEDGKPSGKPIRFTADDGTEIILRGVADRIDRYRDDSGREYLRIVDYKTGSKTFSLDNVAKGLDVQLLLYLFSVWKYGLPGDPPDRERIPAGAVYFSIRPAQVLSKSLLPAEEAKERSIRGIVRSGVLLADEEILDAMDEGLSGRYAAVKKDAKTGELTAGRATSLLTVGQFGELYGEMEAAVRKIAAEIRSGQSGARPRRSGNQTPCEWCPNSVICKNTKRR